VIEQVVRQRAVGADEQRQFVGMAFEVRLDIAVRRQYEVFRRTGAECRKLRGS
jgi:hypothetical protein